MGMMGIPNVSQHPATVWGWLNGYINEPLICDKKGEVFHIHDSGETAGMIRVLCMGILPKWPNNSGLVL